MQSSLQQFNTATEPDTPTEPQTLYEDIETDNDLIEYSKQYAATVIDEYNMTVDLDRVNHWDVSHRAKRRAAAVKYPKLKSTRTKIGVPIDWDTIKNNTSYSTMIENSSQNIDDVRDCVMSLTWTAFEKFSKDEWQKTIRHELIHVEEFQRYGTTNHGPGFKARASELDTDLHCEKFHTGDYLLVCDACGDVKTDRVRYSKNVKRADPDHSLNNTLKTTTCCDAPITLEDNS